MTPNRGARVRPIDHDFIRDIYEIEMLIEPALTHWFVGMATDADIVALEQIQARDRGQQFRRPGPARAARYASFTASCTSRHYNQHAAELWWKHREILRAISSRFPTTLTRRAAVVREHRELIEQIRAGDADGAAAAIARHVEGSGRHILEQMRAGARTPTPADAG